MPISFPLMFARGLAEPCECPPLVANGPLVLGGSSTQNLTLATTNNFSFVGLDGIARLRLTTQGDLDSVLTGLAAQQDGFFLLLTNVDQTPNTITLSHADVLSAAANRFYLPGAVDLVLGQYESALLWYDETLNAGAGGWLSLAS